MGCEVRTIEGVAADGVLHVLQRAFVAEQAAQCGYCVPGILIALVSLFERTRMPSDTEVSAALTNHLCRCGAHPRMLRAVRRAVRELGTP